MKIRFWGVRGSIPTPGENTVKYGGNTACFSIETEENVHIFDAGTGIRVCGNYLMGKGGKVSGNIFISHTHWDHIQGFPFFVPSFIPGNEFKIFGPPSDVQKLSLKEIMEMQTNYEFFPVRVAQLAAGIDFVDCREGKLDAEELEVETCKVNHPVSCFAYKIKHNGKTVVYGGDHEPYRNIYRDSDDHGLDEEFLEELDQNTEQQNRKIADFIRGADAIIWDSQYTEEEYPTRRGWGHSTYEADIKLATEAEVKRIFCTHHDPMASDSVLEEREEKYSAIAKDSGLDLQFAREGMIIEL